jgi:glycerophosphoryl diester phosphodiesterase
MEKPKVIAHTGCMNTALNSRESVQEALNWDIDYIEVDIRFDPDGNPILSHDPPENFTSCISLKEILDIIAAKKKVNMVLDLKEWPSLSKLAMVINNAGFSQKAIYSGDIIDDMSRLLEEGTGIPFFPNVYPEMVLDVDTVSLEELALRYKTSGARGIGINYNYLTRELVDQFHRRGLLVSAWTIDDRDAMEWTIGYGVDYITTKRLDIIKEVLVRQ